MDLEQTMDNSGAGDGVTDDSNATSQPDADSTEMVSKEKVQEIVSSRVNEVNDKYQKHQNLVNRLEQVTGMGMDAIEAYLDNYENQAQTQQAAPANQQTNQNQQNPDIDNIKQTATAAGNVAMQTKRQVEEHMLMQDDTYSDYEEHKEDIREFADAKGMPLEQAYWAIAGPDKIEKVRSQTEQKVLQEAKNRGGLTAEGDSSTEAAQKFDLSGDEMQFLKELEEAGMGMSPEEYAELKDARSLDDYNKS